MLERGEVSTDQMEGLCSMDHRVCDQTLVERRQLSAARDGECEQIAVSHPRGIEKAASIHALLIKQGHLVRPEFMAGQSAQGYQQLGNCGGSARRVRVSGMTSIRKRQFSVSVEVAQAFLPLAATIRVRGHVERAPDR